MTMTEILIFKILAEMRGYKMKRMKLMKLAKFTEFQILSRNELILDNFLDKNLKMTIKTQGNLKF